MFGNKRGRPIFNIYIAAALIFLLAFPLNVFAEGETPAETPITNQTTTTESTPVPQETQTPAESTQTPTLESTPVPQETPESQSTETIESNDATTNENQQIQPIQEPVSSDVSGAVDALNQSQAVLVDTNGNPIPLATIDATVALQDPDPQGCPPGVTPTWMGGTGTGCTANYGSIQAAINDALVVNGWTIYIQAGTFVEEININKSITLQGSPGTIIQSPDTLTTDFSNKKPIVFVNSNATVNIDGLVIDGNNKGSANYSFVGIAFHNAGGTVTNNLIKNIMDTTFSGAQHGVGIYALNDDGVNRTIDVIHNTIEDFQKTGMAFTGNGLTVNIENNKVTGEGDTAVTAQNGIQISNGATGSVKNNEVKDMRYTGSGWSAAGILIQNASGTVAVEDNKISDVQSGIYVVDSTANLDGNQIKNTDYGAIIMSYYVAKTASGMINNNTFLNNALAVYTDNPDVSALGNIFEGNSDGFYFDDYWSLGGSLLGIYNYWGCDDGPNTICGQTLHGNINYTPWLIDPDHDYVFDSSDGSGTFKDNCPTTANADQKDSDLDGIGDACDTTPFGPSTKAPLGGDYGLIPVTGGLTVNLSCTIANTLTLSEHVVAFNQTMCGYLANLNILNLNTLPSPMSNGDSFVSGLTINLFKGSEIVQKLENGDFSISFPVPSGMEGKNFSILFWDASSGKYVEVPGIVTSGGFVKVTVNMPGTYVLVTK